MLVKDGAFVSTRISGGSNAGNLNINAEDVQVIGTGGINLENNNQPYPSGLFASAEPFKLEPKVPSTGNAGTLNITTERMLVQDGAFVSVAANSQGNGGDLAITANTLGIKDGAIVSSSTSDAGKGGNVTVNAQDIQLTGESSGLLSRAGQNSTGDAGNLTLFTSKLLVQDGAVVSAGSLGKGKGGSLNIEAQENVQLIGGSTGLLTTEPNSIVDAGDVNITTDTLLLTNGAKVDASTFGEGTGGKLTVYGKDVQLIGRSQDNQFGSTLATSAQPNSTGDAGDVNIYTDTLKLKDGGTITAESQGIGTAGDININIKDNFNADNGQIITQSQQSSGGNINITVGKNILLRNNSNIKTILFTTDKKSGDINLEANAIVALEDSDILAFATEGTGGNINLNNRPFFSKPLYRPRPQNTESPTCSDLQY